MINSEINLSLTFIKCIYGSTSTTFSLPSKYSEVYIANDGASTLTLSGNFGRGLDTLPFLAGETMKMTFYSPVVSTITVTATDDFRIFLAGE